MFSSVFSPIKSYRNWRLRNAKKLLSRYNAAKTTNFTGTWSPYRDNHNLLIAASSPLIRARTRDLVRNFPPFTRAINAYTAFVVGRGARFQSLVTDENGKPDEKTRNKIEYRFKKWMEQDADISRRLHFYEQQQLACRQFMENGEWIARMVTVHNRKRHPFAIQMHEAEDLASNKIEDYRSGTKILNGVEYNPHTGEPLHYHFQNSQELGLELNFWSEDAENVLHGFQTLRAGQLRGVSAFAAAILIARDMADYTESELGAAKMSARWLAFIKSADSYASQMNRGVTPWSNDSTDLDDDGQHPLKGAIENATIEYLNESEEVQFAQPANRPGDSFDRFTRFSLRMVSILTDVPYEILSGDYTDINYSTSKASRNDTMQMLIPHRFRLEQHFIRPAFYRFLDFEALTEDYLPNYFSNPEHYRKAMFIPAGMPSVDPLRDGKADIDAINAGITSPQAVILKNGGDPEEVIEQRKAWVELCELKGLTASDLSLINTNLSNNPAKLGAAEYDS